MAKAVVLNSGGFDSVTLLNYLHTIQEEKELYSLHFLYGARNTEQQRKCVQRVCNKLKIPNKGIVLPRIDWTRRNFFSDVKRRGKGEEFNQYVEYRNFIFLSYAASYAEAIGAEKIYVAFLNQHNYPDTTIDFLRGLNSFLELNGITIDAPFIFDNKTRLGHIAKYLGITDQDYFSCDNPDEDGKPCGECLDCKALEEIQKKLS